MSYDSSLSNFVEKTAYLRLFDALVGHNLLLEANPPLFTILAATPERLRDVGMTKEAVIGKPLFEVHPGSPIDPTDNGANNLRSSLNHVLRYRETHHLPVQRYDLPDEQGVFTEKYWRASNRPVFNGNGEVAYIIHTAEEITAQIKSAQQEIQMEGVEKIFSLFMHAPVVVGLVNGKDHVLELANEAAFKLSGKQPQEIIGKPIIESLPELGGQGIIELFDQVRISGKAFTAQEVPLALLVKGRKELHYFNLVYQPYYEKNRKHASGVFTISYDITEHVLARKKLEEKEAALEAALEQVRLSKEAAELGTFDMNLENGDLHWDDRCRILFGISHHNPVSYEKDFVQGLHPADRERILKVIEQLFVKSISNGNYDVEYRTVGAEDGVVRWVRAKGKVYFNAAEKPVRFIGSVLDITPQVDARRRIENLVDERTAELAQANETLQNINKELQRSNANLEEFAYAASHDLKEPVRKIHFFTNQLKSQLGAHLKGAEVHSFNRIEKATERMRNLIDDLLLYSHVSQRPLAKESVNLNQKIQNVIEDLELDIAEKNATVHVDKLPNVNGYRRQLQQLFQNLVSNALKYSRPGVLPSIHISAEKIVDNGKIYDGIMVQDNGIGFEPEYADKIFQMFTRLHGKNEYSGTGVGLSIVKKVVENHNGLIRVKSTPGEGSTFSVLLPLE